MVWKPAKYQGRNAWREPGGHYLVRHEEHWELLHPKKNGVLAFYGLRADGQPPLPSAVKKITGIA